MSSATRLVNKGGFWLGRAVRVSLAAALVLVSLGFVTARVAYGRVTDGMVDFGDELRQMNVRNLSGEHVGNLYEVVLNGQPVASTNASTRHSMHEVLDYFQGECKEDANGMGDKLANLPPTLEGLEPGHGTEGVFTVRREQEDRGFVFCVATNGAPSRAELIGRVRNAGKTGDFGLIGDMRYVTVYKEGTGARAFTAWTHGSFNLYAMFPAEGDAPGEDLGGVPRPDGSRRILSATVVGAPFGVNAYEAQGAREEVLRGLDAKLSAQGWKLVPTAPGVPNDTQFYTLGNLADLGVNARTAGGGRTQVSYIVSRGMASATR